MVSVMAIPMITVMIYDGVVNSEFFYIYVVIFSVLISGPGLSRWYNSILSTYLQYCSWLVQRQVRFWQLEILIF